MLILNFTVRAKPVQVALELIVVFEKASGLAMETTRHWFKSDQRIVLSHPQ